MPMPLQAKLLRVLQEREVERVGGHKAIPLDIRIIATSNRDMGEVVARGNFREDLYYRLNVFPLELPPLRERPLDIVPLARHLIGRLGTALGRPGISLSSAAAEQLTRYAWPGNIRELENVIQRAMILSPGDRLEPEHLLLPKSELAVLQAGKAVSPGGAVNMKTLERTHILETLASVGGSRKRAAEKLGMSERTLRYKLQQYREESEETGQ
jgi:two-component system response regulator FlrC